MARPVRDKGDLIAHIIATEAVDPTRALMVGDRKFDCIGAKRHGIGTVGVLWGHGTEAELRSAGAVALVSETAHLPSVIARHA